MCESCRDIWMGGPCLARGDNQLENGSQLAMPKRDSGPYSVRRKVQTNDSLHFSCFVLIFSRRKRVKVNASCMVEGYTSSVLFIHKFNGGAELIASACVPFTLLLKQRFDGNTEFIHVTKFLYYVKGFCVLLIFVFCLMSIACLVCTA